MRLLTLLLFISKLSYAQLDNPMIFLPQSGASYMPISENMDSINVRWKLIKSDQSNHFLFQSNDASSLSNLIIKAILEGENVFYLEKDEIESKTKMYPKVYPGNRLKSDRNNDDNWRDNRAYLQICLEDDYPLFAENGDPIIVTDGGDLFYIYPATDQLTIEPYFDGLTIYIREEYTLNPFNNKKEWTPVGLNLYAKEVRVKGMTLWIDLRSLFKHNPNSSHRALEYLFTKSYKGFQYMQFLLNQF